MKTGLYIILETSLQTCSRAPKQDKCDQYLKYLTNPELSYHNYIEDPFLKMQVKIVNLFC